MGKEVIVINNLFKEACFFWLQFWEADEFGNETNVGEVEERDAGVDVIVAQLDSDDGRDVCRDGPG